MPFPNPAGYYGLQLTQDIEESVTELDYDQTVTLTHSIIYHLGEGKGDRFYSFIPLTPSSFDAAIDKLSTQDKISFLRWLAERLEWHQHPNTIRNKETWS
jgi:hypothetical protein